MDPIYLQGGHQEAVKSMIRANFSSAVLYINSSYSSFVLMHIASKSTFILVPKGMMLSIANFFKLDLVFARLARKPRYSWTVYGFAMIVSKEIVSISSHLSSL